MTFQPGTPAAVLDLRRYHDVAPSAVTRRAERSPVCLHLETTNRCNPLCTPCPCTYAEFEPPADMSWEFFTRIVNQVPKAKRVVLHGVGEPMPVNDLPRMVQYLKARGAYVLFNTNGTLLNDRNGRALIDDGSDELRVPHDASTLEIYLAMRDKYHFDRMAEEPEDVVASRAASVQDFVVGSRTRGIRGPGNVGLHQIVEERAVGRLLGPFFSLACLEIEAFRDIRRDALSAHHVRETSHGWNVETQVRAARARLRVLEVLVAHRARTAGLSKVAGSVRGTVAAARRIVAQV